MSRARGGGLVVAAAIGAVEAMKDQLGVCRWNYAFRSVHHHAKTKLKSYHDHILPAINNKSSSTSSAVVVVGKDKIKNKTEHSMKKVMDLNCWGPSTVRF